MSEKRRDNRNRILREGEYQRKDGRYRFRYIDEDGKEKNVYSWRLDKNDPMPKGKKREPSLREKEKQIEADLFDRIVTNGGNYTVLELVEKYVSLKTGVQMCIRDRDNIEWMNDLRTEDNKEAFTQCIAFKSSFRSPKNGGGAWEANEEYTWSWWLARCEGGEWKLMTWGY